MLRLVSISMAIMIMANASAEALYNANNSILAAESEKLVFNRDIRPILAENCFFCHGTDKAKREADLRLDDRAIAIEMKAIIPGNAAASLAIERILETDPDTVMPPPKSHKTLNQAQKDILKRWINEGAEYQPHWAFIAPQKPAIPAVNNKAWVVNPLDAFVLSQLEKMKLAPAPVAEKHILARRVALDLTGLPPSPELLDAYITDQSPEAYEKYIDQLLASPHYGEHRARYWLDMARYADTHGIHFDNYREMWSYRDWVINAFNQNLPFNQFTIEQLAGDLLPDATLEQKIATGFHRCNITTNEGGIIDEEYKVLYARDRTETTTAVWMGLTAGCAVCHDHKYDPITQEDFYQLSAFFNNTTQPVRDGNKKDTPPILPVPLKEDEPRLMAVDQGIPLAEAELKTYKQNSVSTFERWFKESAGNLKGVAVAEKDLLLSIPFNGENNKFTTWKFMGEFGQAEFKGLAYGKGQISQALKITNEIDISFPEAGEFSADKPFSIGLWTRLAGKGNGSALMSRMHDHGKYTGWDLWVENGKVGTHIISEWSHSAIKVMTQKAIPANKWNHIFITYDGSQKAKGVKVYLNGVVQKVEVVNDNLKGDIKTDAPFRVGQRNGGAKAVDVLLSDVRLYTTLLDLEEIKQVIDASQFENLLTKEFAQLTPEEVNEIHGWWVSNVDPHGIELEDKLEKLTNERQAIYSRGTIAHVMNEANSEAKAFMLIRGEYDKHGPEVIADTPDILPAFPADAPRNRLGLARWIMQENQPLTSRITVNQFWQQIFGQGIVKTSGDFGIAGQLPTNPELLDYLATDFRDSGYNIKHFFKQMVMSNTYRQAAITTNQKLELDPDNKYLSRGPRFRMDAEMVRDYALAASGIMNRKIGGPSVRPYQPEGVWEAVAMPGSDTRNYKRDAGDSLYRRSMYTFWKRAAPPASMEILNAPSREFCVMQRERTNTPMQALATLNDDQYIEAARFLAELTILHQHDLTSRLNSLSTRILCRPFSAEELEVVQESHKQLFEYYQQHPEEATKLTTVGEYKSVDTMQHVELATWTMLSNQLLNLDEVLNK